MSMSSKKFLSDFLSGLFNKNSSKDTYVSNIPVRRPTQPSIEEAPPVFEEVLKESESSKNYQAVNPQGYMGAYQFGEARLQDFKDDKDKDFSKEEFLNNKELQKEVFAWHTNDIKNYIKDRKLEKYIGQEIQGSPVTMDGLVAVAHLGGKYGMRKFLETGGEYNPSDANETKLSDYLVKFGNNVSDMENPQMNEGGSVKKQMAEVLNKDAPEGERLAYINSQEEKMLRDAGGSGELTEAGIPSYRGHTDSHGGGGGSGSGGNTGGRGPGDGGQRGRERQRREQERQRKEKEAKAKADREAADRRERARIATEEENRRVSEIKERERQRKADEEAANRREQARIATEEENKRLREIKAKEEARKEARKERKASGSTVSQVEAAFGPTYSGGVYGYGTYLDPTSSTYNPKFNEYYGAGYSSLNYGKTQEILGGNYAEDKYSGELKEKGIIDSIVDTAKDLTTFGENNQFELDKFEGPGTGLTVKYNFKRGGLLDRNSKK